MKKVLVLVAIISTIQCASLRPDRVEEIDTSDSWLGQYHYGGLRYSAGLTLSEGGEFEFGYSTCTSSDHDWSSSWFETENMVYLEPSTDWDGNSDFVRFLKKVKRSGDYYLLPTGHNEFMADQGVELIYTAFILGGSERREEIETEVFVRGLIEAGVDPSDIEESEETE